MNTERLTEFAELLENLPAKVPGLDAFNLGHWYNTSIYEDVGRFSESIRLKEGFCKTSACALGSAALYGPFQAQGLKVEYNDIVLLDEKGYYVMGAEGECDNGLSAGAEFFGITWDQAHWLFIPSEYTAEVVTPQMVAARVKMILAGTDDTERRDLGCAV